MKKIKIKKNKKSSDQHRKKLLLHNDTGGKKGIFLKMAFLPV